MFGNLGSTKCSFFTFFHQGLEALEQEVLGLVEDLELEQVTHLEVSRFHVCISVALACISAKYLPLYMLDLCDPNTIGILYIPHKALEMAEI